MFFFVLTLGWMYWWELSKKGDWITDSEILHHQQYKKRLLWHSMYRALISPKESEE